MADNIENTSIKAPLKKEESTEQAVHNGLADGIKKSLPKIIHSVNETTTKAFSKTVGFVSESISSGLREATSSINKGFSNIKDFGSDLFIDITDAAEDIISPGGLTTMMTGMPFLGAAIDNTVDKVKDTMSDFKDHLAMMLEDEDEDEDDRSYYANRISDDLDETNSIVSNKLDEVVDATDVTNDLLFNMLNVNRSFNKLYKDGQVQLLKDKREQQLRDAEAERERLNAIKKEREENRFELSKKEKDEEGEDSSFLETFFGLKALKGIFAAFLIRPLLTVGKFLGKFSTKGLLPILKIGGKILGKAMFWLGIINSLIEGFKSLVKGGSFSEFLSTIVTEFVRGFIEIPTMIIDLIGDLLGYEWNLTELTDKFVDKIKDWLIVSFDYIINWFTSSISKVFSAFSNNDMGIKKRILTFLEGLGELFFKPVVDFGYWLGNILSNAGKYIIEKAKSILPSWLGGQDDMNKNEEKIHTKFNNYKSNINPILENSKKITEMQRPIQTTIINNNTNNMTQMSNNNAIGKTNMIVNSSLRNMDPTFNQCIIGSYVPSM